MKINKKILAGIFIVSSSAYLMTEAATNFLHIKDLDKSRYPEYVKFAVSEGYMNVDANGNFNPQSVVIREHLAKVLKDFKTDIKSELTEEQDKSHEELKEEILSEVNKQLTEYKENYASLSSNDLDVVSKGMESTVVIYNDGNKGSGVFISDNYILTAYHVVDAKNSPIEITIKGSNKRYTASIINTDQWNDLALIKLDNPIEKSKNNYSTLKIAKNKPSTGESAYAFGHPQTLTYSVTKGIISNSEQSVAMSSKIQFDGQIQPGYSGGPLVNQNGEVVGIITNLLKSPSTGDTHYGISFASQTKSLHSLIEGIDLN